MKAIELKTPADLFANPLCEGQVYAGSIKNVRTGEFNQVAFKLVKDGKNSLYGRYITLECGGAFSTANIPEGLAVKVLHDHAKTEVTGG